jgi:hypothetical protein
VHYKWDCRAFASWGAGDFIGADESLTGGKNAYFLFTPATDGKQHAAHI